MSDLKKILKEEYNKKKSKVTKDLIIEMIEELMNLPKVEPIVEQKEKRFSYTFKLPTLTPTEAWGDPKSMSREQINRIFSVIRGGASIKDRIADVNKFLTPESAKRRRSPNVILNMMMVTEALQATLNDFSESSAGFVFEAFMASLVGGKQITGRVRGTLPIEDFVAFAELPGKEGAPVSLKLLSPKTGIKGSFTNLSDYLFVRGEQKIAYLIAYKNVIGDRVEQLFIFDFEFSRDNLIDALIATNNGHLLAGRFNGRKITTKQLKNAIQEWDGTPAGLSIPGGIADLFTNLSGYTAKGIMHDVVSGKYDPDAPAEEEELSDEELEAIRQKKAQTADIRKIRQALADPKLQRECFHLREKLSILNEQQLITEAKGGPQWEISRAQMVGAEDILQLKSYGELDLSQKNIDELAKIYSDILGEEMQILLENTQQLTENIGRYYTESRRSTAMTANEKGQQDAEQIRDLLEKNPKYDK
tara:strand:- start:59 stop:1483 length:1425 start_codon:yes stop_codon:yes gene_type:complete